MIDVNSLTMGEIALVEKLGGQSISAIADDAAPKGKTMAALALVIKRRNGHPEFTWNDAQNLTFTEVSELLGLEDEDAADDEAEDEAEDPPQD